MDTTMSKGIEVYAELRGEDAAAKMSATLAAEEDSFSKPVSELAARFAFGSVWSRDGLARRERSLVTIGILIALRQPDELRKHVEIGVRNGLSAMEIREVLVQAIPYVGFPAVASAIEVATQALRGAGIDPNSQS